MNTIILSKPAFSDAGFFVPYIAEKAASSLKIVTHSIPFAGQELTLTNQRAIFWPERSSLILSDMHLGKAAHFRQHGIAIPSSVNRQDVHRLEKLIQHFQPRNVLFVGDLVHAGSNSEVDGLKTLTARYPSVAFTLIRGNHDKLELEKLQQMGISGIAKNLQIGDITFSHEPVADPGRATICGHIHPGIRIELAHKKAIRLPCFVVSEKQIILPAFSLFTGLDTRSFDRAACYAFDEHGMYVLPGPTRPMK